MKRPRYPVESGRQRTASRLFTPLALLALAAVTTAAATPARACKCDEPTLSDAVRQADAIFVGYIEAIEQGPQGERVTLSRQRALKGAVPARVVVEQPSDGASCGYDLLVRETVLVMATSRDGLLRMRQCDGSRKVDPKQVDAVDEEVRAALAAAGLPAAVDDGRRPLLTCASSGGFPLVWGLLAIGLGRRARRRRRG